MVTATVRADEAIDFADYTAEFQVETRDANPRVRCFDWRRLQGARTDAREFFLFHQTKTVERVDIDSWRLHISGCVRKPLTLTFADLLRRQSTQEEVTIECSGNSGHPGLMNGLVSSAVWRGPALGPLLRDCGVLPQAREVVFFGMDGEREKKWAAREQEMYMPHGRSLFAQDALDGNALVAIQMNGRPLLPEHGFPARLIVPGWYGMTQVKWLNRIVVLDRRYEGRHMARNYHSIHAPEGPAIRMETSITRMRLKSVVARVTRLDGAYRIHGAAWPGEDKLRKVQVRIDDEDWRDAELDLSSSRFAWSLWSIAWPTPAPGSHRIVSRAIDSRGQVQPEPDEWRRRFSSSREDNSQWTRTVVLA